MKKVSLFILLFFYFGIIQSQNFDWTALSQTVNKPITSLVVYNNQLVAAGNFSMAGTIYANKIASWNGSNWSTFGNGVKGFTNGKIVERLMVYNNELYVGGRFDSVGTIAASNIAKWTGTTWLNFGTGNTNDEIFAMAYFNGELYVGGLFTNINGVPAKQIAKWNGSVWQPVGAGLNSGVSITDLCVFQNQLYAVGAFDTIGNIASQNIARWDGTNWNSVSTGVPSSNSRLFVWQNKLLIGSNSSTINPYPTQMWQWNGTNLSLFSSQSYAGGSRFLFANNQLYSGNTGNNSTGKSCVWEWNSITSQWDSIGTKVQNITALCEYNNEIYCAGFFNTASGAQGNYIAKLALTASLKINLNQELGVKIYPNPILNKLNIDITNSGLKNIDLSIMNSFGQVIFKRDNFENREIDLGFLNSGIYYILLKSDSKSKTFKVLKE